MAERTLTVNNIILRNDTLANWESKNPVLLKGEVGIVIDKKKFKIGDGVTAWDALDYASGAEVVENTTNPTESNLGDVGAIWINTTSNKPFICVSNDGSTAVWKQIVTPEELENLGAGDMLKAVYDADNNGAVDKADRLTSAFALTLGGDATGTVSIDGSADVSLNVVLKNSGVTAGTYTKLTVDGKGIVTGAEQITADDVPALTLAKISDAGTAAAKDTGLSAGNIPVLDSNGKIDTSILPSLALTETFEVANEAEMLALNAQPGDIAIRDDLSQTFILKAEPATTAANWIVLKTPTDAVLSVNGKTGAVTLTSDNIEEGASNLYYTDARATANFDTNFAAKSVSGLSDGAKVLMSDDTYIIDGGNA